MFSTFKPTFSPFGILYGLRTNSKSMPVLGPIPIFLNVQKGFAGQECGWGEGRECQKRPKNEIQVILNQGAEASVVQDSPSIDIVI